MGRPNKHWCYDDEDYYSYVLVNGSLSEFEDVKRALIANNIVILKAAASFRPASNGSQYDWYIRVEGAPSRNEIDAIVSPLFYKPSPVKTPKLARGEITVAQPAVATEAQSLAALTALEEKAAVISRLEGKINGLETSLAQARYENDELTSQLGLLNTKLKLLQSSYEAVNEELQNSRQWVDDLLARMEELVDTTVVENLKAQYEIQLNEKTTQITTLRDELQAYIDGFGPEVEAKKLRIQELENEIAILKQEKADLLIEQYNDDPGDETHPKPGSENFFKAVVENLIPKVEFLRSSIRFIWNELPDECTLEILHILGNLSTIQGKRVECDTRWREYRTQNTWRLYYRSRKEGAYQILISDKENQKKDFDWLKLQPDV